MSSPRRHGRHSPQEMNGCTITVSPTSTLVTPGADLVHPAGVLVARACRAARPRTSPPTGPPGCAGRCGTGRPRRSARSRRAGPRSWARRPARASSALVVRVQPRGLHAANLLSRGSRSGSAATRQMPPLASRLRLTSRAIRSHSPARPRVIGVAVAGDTNAGAPDRAASPSAARSSRQRSRLAPASGRSATRSATTVLGGAPRPPAAPRTRRAWRATQRLALEQLAQRVEVAVVGLARERVGEARRRARPRR